MPVGVPGGPRSHHRGPGNKAKASAYRHSEKGMMAKRTRDANPEHRARVKARRDIKRRMKGGY